MEKLIDICKSPETGINIWLIINGIRPAYWLDSYKIQSKKKMDELLEELKKYEFIGYKFLEEYEKKESKNGAYFPEGPLIYNKKILNKKETQKFKTVGQWFGSVGRAVSSDSRGPRFESSHRRKVISNIYFICFENKEKEAWNGPLFLLSLRTFTSAVKL